MDQKYKFFISDWFIQIAEKEVGIQAGLEVKRFDDDDQSLEYITQVFDTLILRNDVVLVVENQDVFFDILCKRFRLIEAAGGYVLNGLGQLLMIFRKGFWDLPKGKLELDETIKDAAIREVEEECGVKELNIESAHFITHHLYKDKKGTVIKRSYWFLMQTLHNGPLIPQTEEDIESALWVETPIENERLKAAYSSIREVVNHFSGS